MAGRSYLFIGLLTIFIATFSIFFIFLNIEKMVQTCKTNPGYSSACKQLNNVSISLITLLLIVGGFVLIISLTSYIILSAT